MTCEHTRRRLTAYLDGDLDADGGTLVRVHLRGCAACRQAASDEAALRDGLRALPALDPSPSMWAGIQARLAAAEEVEASRPRWRRALARWAPAVPRFATGGMLAAAAVAVVWWRTDRGAELETVPPRPVPEVRAQPGPELRSSVEPPRPPDPAPPVVPPSSCHLPEASDVTADLALDDARRSGCYAAAVEALLAHAGEVRPEWTSAQRSAFDDRIASLRQAVSEAEEGRARHRAWRSMVRYLQRALARDEVVALAGGGRP